MNFIELESAQKLRGGYYTPPDIAAYLTQWVLEIQPERILEPACGDGIFFEALGKLDRGSVRSIVGCELDAEEAQKAQRRARSLKKLSFTLHVDDFLRWFLTRNVSVGKFDAVLGNPPFVRYQYLNPEQQTRAEQVFRNYGLPFTKLTNAWVPFVVASLALLRPGGRLAMVVPAELLHVLHARSLRHFLLEQCSRVLVIDPEGIWFHGTLQGVVLLLAEKRAQDDDAAAEIAIVPVKDRDCLLTPASVHFQKADVFPSSALNGKWMLGLLSRRERSLFNSLGGHRDVHSFQDIAKVDVGIVTGANKFFLVTDAVVREYHLAEWAHPMFGRSDHVQGVIYDPRSHKQNKRLGLPTNFLWFGSQPLAELPEPTRRYLAAGEMEGLHRRYKCRIRTPWYSVPSVYVAPVGMLKRSHHFPRLVLNTAKAFTTDTAYRIVPHKTHAVSLVLAFVNSLTALSAELEGRHYGGGVLELVPSEIERLLIPYAPNSLAALRELDTAVRQGTPPETLLARQDRLLLKPLGISKQDCEQLLSAWIRLRNRRQRTTNAAVETDEDPSRPAEQIACTHVPEE